MAIKVRLEECQALDMFDKYLDDVNDPVVIMGMTYDVSDILKNCDPIAYRVIFHDWIDSVGDEYEVEGYL